VIGQEMKWFRSIPEKCNCKLLLSTNKAQEFIDQGKAIFIYGIKRHKLYIDETQILLPVEKRQTPRVDLITKADIERAYCDKIPKYIEYIEMVHEMIMIERAKLIVPFREDPTEGRLLFPFGADQRTYGGHGHP
jgi:hypothetical protein